MTFYLEGRDSYDAGLKLCDCPYKKLTFGFKEWIRGFLHAQSGRYA